MIAYAANEMILSPYIITSILCFGAAAFIITSISILLWTAASGHGDENKRTATALIIGLLAWAAIGMSTAYMGVLNFVVFLPFALIPIALGTAISYHPAVAALLARVPVHRIVFLQTYRVAGFVFVYLYYATGELSRGFALNAGWGDVLTGVLALPVGWMLLKGMRGAKMALVVWCVIGIGDLILAPASAYVFGAKRLVEFPINTIPLFLGPPLGILLHIISLRIFFLSRAASQLTKNGLDASNH